MKTFFFFFTTSKFPSLETTTLGNFINLFFFVPQLRDTAIYFFIDIFLIYRFTIHFFRKFRHFALSHQACELSWLRTLWKLLYGKWFFVSAQFRFEGEKKNYIVDDFVEIIKKSKDSNDSSLRVALHPTNTCEYRKIYCVYIFKYIYIYV